MSCIWQAGLAVIAFLVVFELWHRLRKRKGVLVSLLQINSGIEYTISQGRDGTKLVVLHEKSGGYVEFRKTIPRPSPTSFRMVASSLKCSKPQLLKAQEALRRVGIDFSLKPISGGAVTELVVECGPDPDLAGRALRTVLADVFAVDYDAEVRVWQKGHFVPLGFGRMIGWERHPFVKGGGRLRW